jgi:hypothetical protein
VIIAVLVLLAIVGIVITILNAEPLSQTTISYDKSADILYKICALLISAVLFINNAISAHRSNKNDIQLCTSKCQTLNANVNIMLSCIRSNNGIMKDVFRSFCNDVPLSVEVSQTSRDSFKKLLCDIIQLIGDITEKTICLDVDKSKAKELRTNLIELSGLLLPISADSNIERSDLEVTFSSIIEKAERIIGILKTVNLNP